MKVAVVGMGALGRVYGVRLALRAACEVTYVVRPGRGPVPLRLERIDGDHAVETVDSPSVATAIAASADVVVVGVRAEQLDASLDAILDGAPDVPVVMLTPLLPPDLARLVARHGARIRAGMPGVVGYLRPDGTCRYWLPKAAPTSIDAEAPVPDSVEGLARAMSTAGFGGRLEPRVRDTNPATTVAFIPLAMGVDAAGGVAPLLADKALLRITLDAVSEGLLLADKLGQVPGWVGMLTRFAGPITLSIGVGILKSRSPEVLAYVDDHFGRKLHAQNVAMARSIVALARERGTPGVALTALEARLAAAA